jgi:hypothetical protein
MKKYLLSFISLLIIVSCAHKDEVNFKLPEIPYATAGATTVTNTDTPVVKKKEFAFPTVPYAE